MVNTNEIAKEYRLSHWAGIMQRRTENGMSIREYCISIGISENTYYYWQRRVRQATCELLLPTVQAEISKPAAPTGWALVEPAKEHPHDSAVIIESGSFRVRVAADTDMELLAKVCRMLVSLC
jgi:putative transposase